VAEERKGFRSWGKPQTPKSTGRVASISSKRLLQYKGGSGGSASFRWLSRQSSGWVAQESATGQKFLLRPENKVLKKGKGGLNSYQTKRPQGWDGRKRFLKNKVKNVTFTEATQHRVVKKIVQEKARKEVKGG